MAFSLNSKSDDAIKCRIFIGNLPSDSVTKESMRQVFSQFGTYLDCSIYKNFGFVQFGDEKSAHDAVKGVNHTIMFDRRLDVKIATKNPSSNAGTKRKSEDVGNTRGLSSVTLGSTTNTGNSNISTAHALQNPYHIPGMHPPVVQNPYNIPYYNTHAQNISNIPTSLNDTLRLNTISNSSNIRPGIQPSYTPTATNPLNPNPIVRYNPIVNTNPLNPNPIVNTNPLNPNPIVNTNPQLTHINSSITQQNAQNPVQHQSNINNNINNNLNISNNNSVNVDGDKKRSTTNISDKYLCDIICSHKKLYQYAEFIEYQLNKLGIISNINVICSNYPLDNIIKRLARDNVTCAVVLKDENEAHHSISLHTFGNNPEEHRNMPVDVAEQFLKKRLRLDGTNTCNTSNTHNISNAAARNPYYTNNNINTSLNTHAQNTTNNSNTQNSNAQTHSAQNQYRNTNNLSRNTNNPSAQNQNASQRSHETNKSSAQNQHTQMNNSNSYAQSQYRNQNYESNYYSQNRDYGAYSQNYKR